MIAAEMHSDGNTIIIAETNSDGDTFGTSKRAQKENLLCLVSRATYALAVYMRVEGTSDTFVWMCLVMDVPRQKVMISENDSDSLCMHLLFPLCLVL